MSSAHFTYEPRDSTSYDQLLQGDVLERTDELSELLGKFYPYAYQHLDKYSYFVVLTQSCDLVQEGQRKRKADQITLCAARSIHLFIDQEVLKVRLPQLQKLGIGFTQDKERLIQKIERLLSNDESPFFYLHPSAETPFSDAQVAYLRVTFPVRTSEHHDVCLKAKKVQLAPEFRAKLGWLTAVTFGRVATEDFPPQTRHKFALQYIEGHGDWMKADALRHEATRRGHVPKLAELSAEELGEVVAAVLKKSKPEIVADEIIRIARKVWPEDETRLGQLRGYLLRDSEFQATQGS